MNLVCSTEPDKHSSTSIAKSFNTQDTLSPRSPFGPKSSARFIRPKNFDPSILDLEILENYYVWSDIGKGTFATVRFATQKHSGQQVALKIYEKSKLKDPTRDKSVQNEIQILHALDHPNIVKLVEEVDGEKNFYLVMEYVQGCSLFSFITKKSWNQFDEVECARIFVEIVEALEYCHRNNVAHRDVKLENIIVDALGHVKLIDFGFATMSASRERKSFLYCGTPNYMAPEIVKRERYAGEPADIWAAGVVLFMMLTGKFPFGSYSEAQVFSKILKNDVVYPDGISFKCKKLLRAMLEPCCGRRISAEDVLRHPWIVEQGKTVKKNMPLKGDMDEVNCG